MVKQIELTQDKIAIVDDDDFEYLSRFRWYAAKNYKVWYAYAHIYKADGKRTTLSMHNLLMNPQRGMVTDHIDRDGLNNTRANLRVCTPAENSRNTRLNRNNTSGYRGVVWHSGNRKWRASIRFQGKRRWLGQADTPEAAAQIYDEAARLLHGDFACLNFPTGEGC